MRRCGSGRARGTLRARDVFHSSLSLRGGLQCARDSLVCYAPRRAPTRAIKFRRDLVLSVCDEMRLLDSVGRRRNNGFPRQGTLAVFSLFLFFSLMIATPRGASEEMKMIAPPHEAPVNVCRKACRNVTLFVSVERAVAPQQRPPRPDRPARHNGITILTIVNASDPPDRRPPDRPLVTPGGPWLHHLIRLLLLGQQAATVLNAPLIDRSPRHDWPRKQQSPCTTRGAAFSRTSSCAQSFPVPPCS
jgi:hypothetical protein